MGWSNVRDCWRQVAELKHIIRQVVTDMKLDMGVTDGSQAKPGEIGEVMATQVKGTFLATPQTQLISTLVLSPGDWQVSAACYLNVTTNAMTGAQFNLSPLPVGAQTDISAAVWSPSTATDPDLWTVQLSSIPTAVNVTVPTLLAFSLQTNNTSTGSPATGPGTWAFNVQARRMR
jgi:hypothetical protein